MKNYKKIEKLLSRIDIDCDLSELSDVNIKTFEELRDYLQEQGLFDVEIIYYSNAMEYLSEYDPSLRTSLELAYDLGYTLENEDIASEILASLLASQRLKEDFQELQNEIEELLEN